MATLEKQQMLPPMQMTHQQQHRPLPLPPSNSSHHPASNNLGHTMIPVPPRRMPQAGTGPSTSRSLTSLAFPQSATIHNLTGHGAQMHSSCTWTTSSGELGMMSDTDELEDRTLYVQEYNRLASKVHFSDHRDWHCHTANGVNSMA